MQPQVGNATYLQLHREREWEKVNKESQKGGWTMFEFKPKTAFIDSLGDWIPIQK